MGFDFRSSFISFHLSGSSTMYNTGNSFRSLESPIKKRVDRFINSSKIESFIYPDVVQLNNNPSGRAPIPDFMTSYCFRPLSPSHAATSSHMHKDGLKPSDFLEENAIFFTMPLLLGKYKSLCRWRGMFSMNLRALVPPSR